MKNRSYNDASTSDNDCAIADAAATATTTAATTAVAVTTTNVAKSDVVIADDDHDGNDRASGREEAPSAGESGKKKKRKKKESRRGRKLILHVDLRNTIIVADSVTNIDIEQAINGYLTGVLWGRVTDGRWTWVSREPSLRPPEPDTMTYYKYLERSTVSVPADRAQLRMATGDFTSREIGARFRPYFEKYLPMLRWKGARASPSVSKNDGCDGDSDDSGIEPENRSSGSASGPDSRPDGLLTTRVTREDGRSERYHYIIPSFVRLLRRLCDRNRDFCLVLRTYGLDAPNVLASIRRIVSGEAHPDFPVRRQLSFCTSVGRVRRFERDGDHTTSVEMNFTPERAGIVRATNSGNRKRRPEPDCSGRLEKSPRRSAREPGSGLRGVKNRLQRGMKELARSLSLCDYGTAASCWSGGTASADCSREAVAVADNVDSPVAIGDDRGIAEALNDLERGVYALVDDFAHWQSHGYSRLAAKPLWIALPKDVDLVETATATAMATASPAQPPVRTSETHHHVFFDDNIRVGDDDSIVDLRLYDWRAGRWRSSTGREMELCENVFLVQANLLESLENENYFVEKLELCERNLDGLLGSETR